MRAQERTNFTIETRVTLLEGDVDAVDSRIDGTNERLDKILWVLVGMLISVTTACILLAINLVVGR